MAGTDADTTRAAVTFDAPHGRDSLVLHDGDVMVVVGDGFAPAEPEFQVAVQGTRAVWSFTVRVRLRPPAPVPADGTAPTRSFDLAFSPQQRRILAAYLRPLTRGCWEPATHREVATASGYHPNTVREVLYEVWSMLFAEGVPLPDISDKRLAVVEALRLHRLLADDPAAAATGHHHQ